MLDPKEHDGDSRTRDETTAANSEMTICGSKKASKDPAIINVNQRSNLRRSKIRLPIDNEPQGIMKPRGV